MPIRPGRYAAIDVGTVTCRLLVADVDDAGLYEIDREYAIANLGEGVDGSGVLGSAAIRRVAEAIAGFKKVLARLSPSDGSCVDVVAFATSAARDAENRNELVERLAEEGIDLAVISGEREASLSFAGASCAFPDENLAVVDIGGGSTEVALGRSGGAPDRFHSFDIGCRRVTEKFFSQDPPSTGDLVRARTWVMAEMRPFFESMDGDMLPPARLIAVAGTATTVVSVRDHMEIYDAERVHGTLVSRNDLDEVYRRLSRVPLEERRRVVGLEPGRAPVIVAGLVIMQAVLDLVGVDSLTVSETDILHGAIMDVASDSTAIVPTASDVPFALHLKKMPS